MVSFLLLMELTTASYATLVGNLALTAFAAGEIVVTVMAYFCRHWLLLKWIMSAYVILLVPYLYFLPESPHWLLTKHRYDELERQLDQMARMNRRSNADWLPTYHHFIECHRQERKLHAKAKIQLSFTFKARRFLTHVPTMSKLVISGFLGFLTLLLYFKISFSLGDMDEIDPYLNLVIGAFVEVIGYIAASLFMIRYGRKPILILFLILTALCLVFTPYSLEQDRLIAILTVQLGKFAISAAVGVTYIFVPELFPTTIRGTGTGFFGLMSRLGSTLAPMVDASIKHNRSSVTNLYYLYALLIIFCTLITLLLPETRNVPLADKIDYKIYEKKKTPA
jgi:MFS family permease